MNELTDKFIWHDGNITEFQYSVGVSGVSIRLIGEFYSATEDKNRDKYTINCEGVEELANKVDFCEILDNFVAGSVATGYLKQGSLWIYLLDGVIEIKARGFNVLKH